MMIIFVVVISLIAGMMFEHYCIEPMIALASGDSTDEINEWEKP